MSKTRALDRIADMLALDAQHPQGFEALYGKHAVTFFVQLPWIFRLLRRVSFDLAVPQKERHLAGISTLYIAEHQDFLDDVREDQQGLIDDVWIAYRALAELADNLSEESLATHWKGPGPLADVISLARNLDHLTDQLPTKVQEKADAYLGIVEAKAFLGLDDDVKVKS